jgi:hypothetical protein
MRAKRLHNAIPYLIQILGIYILFLGVVSAVVGGTLLRFGEPASIFIGIALAAILIAIIYAQSFLSRFVHSLNFL